MNGNERRQVPSIKEIVKIYGEAAASIKDDERLERDLKLIKCRPDFSGETLDSLNRWADQEAEKGNFLHRILASSLEVIELYDKNMLGQAEDAWAGHDQEMTFHYNAQALRMVGRKSEMAGKYAVWELLTAVTLHNVGRFLGHSDKIHAQSGALLLAKISGDLFGKPASEEERQAYLRVVYHVKTHTQKNNGDPIGDLVKACDRLQQVGVQHPLRSLAYDVGVNRDPLLPEITDDKRGKVAYVRGSSLVEWTEFLARNLYPFFDSEVNGQNPSVFQEIMRENQAIANYRRAFSVAALMIACDYKPGEPAENQTPLAQQTFAPELGIISSNIHWSKRSLPDDIRNMATRIFREYEEEYAPRGLDETFTRQNFKETVQLLLSASGSYVASDAVENIRTRFEELDLQERTRLWRMFDFCLKGYTDLLESETGILENLKEHPDQNIKSVANETSNRFKDKFSSKSALTRLRKKWKQN